MSQTMLRLFIVNVTVLGYFPLREAVHNALLLRI